MSQPYSTSGFYKAPVSKALIILGSALSGSLVLLGPRYQNYFVYSNDYLLRGQELWRLVTSKLTFLEIHSLLLGASLLYHFRILERRYGSTKFASFVLANALLCIGVEAATVLILQSLEYNVLPQTLCGPQSIVLSLFIPYFLDIPSIATQPHMMTELLTGKWVSYVLGIYLTTLTHTTPLVIAYGITAGILYRFNFLYIKSWMAIPRSVSSICHRALGWLLYSRPPREGALPMGATLEIQRQQRMEYLEQRMLLAQAQRFRTVQRQNALRRPVRQTFPFRRPGPEAHRPGQQNNLGARLPNGGPSPPPPSSSPPVTSSSTSSPNTSQPPPQDPLDVPSTSAGTASNAQVSGPEDKVGSPYSSAGTASNAQIQQLVDMGFNRGAVMQALMMSNNDVTMATTVLLQE